jgi:uncharacterized protein
MPYRTTAIKALQTVKPQLLAVYPIERLAIFGSVSRGDDTAVSDVDILVEFNRPVGLEFIRLARELEQILQRKVDLVSRGGIKDKYFKAIKADLIYV